MAFHSKVEANASPAEGAQGRIRRQRGIEVKRAVQKPFTG
jgi:hypothetical protein